MRWGEFDVEFERYATNEHDHDLTTHDDDLNGYEVPVSENAFEDVVTIIESSTVVLIKDLHPDKDVENEG